MIVVNFVNNEHILVMNEHLGDLLGGVEEHEISRLVYFNALLSAIFICEVVSYSLKLAVVEALQSILAVCHFNQDKSPCVIIPVLIKLDYFPLNVLLHARILLVMFFDITFLTSPSEKLKLSVF